MIVAEMVAAVMEERLLVPNNLKKTFSVMLKTYCKPIYCKCYKYLYLSRVSVQFSSVYCFAIKKCTNASYYHLNINCKEAQGKPPGL